MKSKKIRSLFCAAALTLSLAACGSKTSDYSDQTITGEITDIDGTAVTMQLGELSAGGMPSHDVSGSSDSGQTPPDKPDGETQSGSSFSYSNLELCSLDANSSYDLQIYIRDQLNTLSGVNLYFTVPQGTPLVALRKKKICINTPTPDAALNRALHILPLRSVRMAAPPCMGMVICNHDL